MGHFETVMGFIPIWNAIYMTFFHTGASLSREGMESMFNTVALVSALLLTIAIALPMSIGRDEAEMVLFQFSRHGPYGCAGDERNLVTEYAEWSYNSIVFLTVSLLTTVLQLMTLSALPSAYAKDADERMEAFSGFQKLLAIVAIGALVFGLVATALATQFLVLFKIPDDSHFNFCKSIGWSMSGEEDYRGNSMYKFPDDLNVAAASLLGCDYRAANAANAAGEPDACKGQIVGLPDRFACCKQLPTQVPWDPDTFVGSGGANQIDDRNSDWTWMAMLVCAANLTIVGWGMLAYHTNTSPIRAATQKCYDRSNGEKGTAELTEALADAGLSVADLKQLPKEHMWPALEDAGITEVADKVKVLLLIQNGGDTQKAPHGAFISLETNMN